jgi:hypothetical protein
MAKVKEITVGGAYTYQAAQYHPVKGEIAVTMEVADGEDPQEAIDHAHELVVTSIVQVLANVEQIHVQIYQNRKSPTELMEEKEAPEKEEDDWSGSVLFEEDDDEPSSDADDGGW